MTQEAIVAAIEREVGLSNRIHDYIYDFNACTACQATGANARDMAECVRARREKFDMSQRTDTRSGRGGTDAESSRISPWLELLRRNESSTMSDNVNHPKHYTSHPSGVEAIQITRHYPGNIAAAMKYLWRAPHKNGTEDYRKAIWCIADEIDRIEGNSDKPSSVGTRIKAALKDE